jgi:formylglycine-generating enzyme required for sulfatase activity
MNLADFDLRAIIVAICKDDGQIVGTGFVVGEQLIVTCAHVVEHAGSLPGGVVTVQFHISGERRSASVLPECWRSVESDDIAVLRLQDALPAHARPAILGKAAGIDKHPFRSLGYSIMGDYVGIAASGAIEALVQKANRRHMLQLTSSQLAQGHSGAPVWDDDWRQVVGIVSEVYHPGQDDKNRDTAFATPIETLQEILRNVRPAIEVPARVPTWKVRPPYSGQPIAGATVVFIQGGTFLMGSDDTRFPDEHPRHAVHVSDFYIDQYSVTNEEFKRFLDEEANKGWRPQGDLARQHADKFYLAHWKDSTYPEGKADHPLVRVSWHAARAYAEWANKRLVTEAEWEYAARVGSESAYWWGDAADPRRANFFRSRQRDTTSVTAYPPNPWGLYDMLGNVYEWCADWYSSDYYSRLHEQDPTGPHDGDERVCRGGAFDSVADHIRASARGKAGPMTCSATIGFRCAKSALTR